MSCNSILSPSFACGVVPQTRMSLMNGHLVIHYVTVLPYVFLMDIEFVSKELFSGRLYQTGAMHLWG